MARIAEDVRMRRARGAFTLAEIILAIALAAVVATLAGTLVFPDSSALDPPIQY